MGLIHKSALLSLLRLRLEQERTADWQTLHIRDREWYLQQHERGQWGQLRAWFECFGERDGEPFSLLSPIISAIGLITGFLLIAGLLEFHTFERINLLLLLLFAVIIPLLVWVIGLIISADNTPLLSLIKRRLPPWPGGPTASSTLQPLLRQTAVLLGQQFSLLFASAMVLGMLLYILLTDLAFGWSSTLDLSPDSLLAVTSIIAWPWQWLWPDATPTLTLIEQTQFFRSAPMAVNDAACAWPVVAIPADVSSDLSVTAASTELWLPLPQTESNAEKASRQRCPDRRAVATHDNGGGKSGG